MSTTSKLYRQLGANRVFSTTEREVFSRYADHLDDPETYPFDTLFTPQQRKNPVLQGYIQAWSQLYRQREVG